MTEDLRIGVLQLRVIDGYWTATYVLTAPGDDKDPVAFEVARIHLKVCQDFPVRKAAFLELCNEVVADIIERTVGVRPQMQQDK